MMASALMVPASVKALPFEPEMSARVPGYGQGPFGRVAGPSVPHGPVSLPGLSAAVLETRGTGLQPVKN